MSIGWLAQAVRAMTHSPVRNYVLPGLTSELVGDGSDYRGRVRLFTTERATPEFISPHSHRFDLCCLVLSGKVVNTLYKPCYNGGALWYPGTQEYGVFGRYTFIPGEIAARYSTFAKAYHSGEVYGMEAKEIHSISFAADTSVLFFEGPSTGEAVTVLEPSAYRNRVPTFKTESWMFEHEHEEVKEDDIPF